MAVTPTALDGYFKRRYGELEDAVPSFAKVQKYIKFRETKRIGDAYHFPVILQRSHGTTFNGAGGVAGTDFTLNAARSLVSKDANVTGTEFVLQEDISYGTLSRARSQGKAAFGRALDAVVLSMRASAACYLEQTLLYGGTDLGANTTTGPAALTMDAIISDATWAPGLWTQMENALIDVYDSTGATHRNTASTVTVTSVDASAKTLSLTSSSADFDDFAGGAMVSGDIFVPKGADGEWFNGLNKIITNTGTLFGISASTYGLWKSNTYTTTGKLTMATVQAAVTQAVVRGLQEDVNVYVSTYSWTDMMNDLSALRRYADNTKQEMQQGTNKIVFHGANGGALAVEPHPMVKAGEAFGIPKGCLRIGSTDFTFKLPGGNDRFFQNLESKAAVRLRCYWDQAIIAPQPAKLFKITGIDPASD